MPLIVIAICFGLFGAFARITAHTRPGGWLGAVGANWEPVAGVLAVIMLALAIRQSGRAAPARFVLTRQGFGVPYAPFFRSGVWALVIFPGAALAIADAVNAWRDRDFGFTFWMAAPIALFALPVGVLFIAVSRRYAFELTPSGISRPFRRAIPWDAPARGDAGDGPP